MLLSQQEKQDLNLVKKQMYKISKVEWMGFRLISSERSFETVGKFARFHIISRDNHIDLFPRTSAVEKMAILRSKMPLIYFRERTEQFDINLEQSSHVETVCLMSRI